MVEKGNGDWRSLEQFSFGDSPELADELAELVLTGKKRATCWAASDGPSTEVGKRMVMLDGGGKPRAIIETVELTQRRFDEVDEAFAFDEGEDTRTLSSWRKAHRNYFERQGRMRRTCCSIASAFGWSRASYPTDLTPSDAAPGDGRQVFPAFRGNFRIQLRSSAAVLIEKPFLSIAYDHNKGCECRECSSGKKPARQRNCGGICRGNSGSSKSRGGTRVSVTPVRARLSQLY